uniref:Uncharacterized protein n=1 Tax=Nelumbo nucifera TaxID=4432 RepID=A0A822XQ08_NELNU|nr:TPA_asm: hypothetical protein HUJ06_022479 [Nelumbo nucifera]
MMDDDGMASVYIIRHVWKETIAVGSAFSGRWGIKKTESQK